MWSGNHPWGLSYNAGLRMIRLAKPKRARLVFMTGLLVLSWTTATTPQTLDPRAPPRPPQPPREPLEPQDPNDPAAATAPPLPPRWQVSLALLGGYDTNVDFVPEGEGDYGGSLRASLGRIWRGPRRQVTLSLSGSGFVYREQRDADRLDGGVNLDWAERFSSSVGFRLTGYGAYASTTDERIITDIGVLLPRSQSKSFGGGTGLDFRLTARTSLRLGGRYDRLRFDDPSLVGSQSATGEAALARRLGARDEIAFSYGFLRNKDDDRDPLDTHFGALGWTRTLSRHVTLSLQGGAGYNPTAVGGIQQQWYFHGYGSITGTWRRTTLLAQVRQAVTPAYGLGGSQISDTATLSATVPFGSRVKLTIAGTHTWGRSRSGTENAYMSDDANASFSVRLSRYAGLGMGYGYRRQEPDESPTVQHHRGFFGFTYARP